MGLFSKGLTQEQVLAAVDEIRRGELGEPARLPERDLDELYRKMFADAKGWFVVIKTLSWLGGVLNDRLPRERLEAAMNDSMGQASVIAKEWYSRITGESSAPRPREAISATKDLMRICFLGGTSEQLLHAHAEHHNNDAVPLKFRFEYLPTLLTTAGCVAAKTDVSFGS